MSEVPEEVRFSKNAVVMGHAIHESISVLYENGYKTVNPQIVSLAVGLIEVFDKHSLIKGFIKNSHLVCWDNIKLRNEQFFSDNSADIFKHLPMDKINLFKDLFNTKNKNGESVVSQDLKDNIWRILDAMIKISIKYVHKHRKPYSYIKDDKVLNSYDASFFDDVDIHYHAKEWSVKLEYPPKC